jgi:hypothetical protein
MQKSDATSERSSTMKTLIATTLASAVLLGFTAVATAKHFDDVPDLEQNILFDHTPAQLSTYVTPGENDEYGSVLFFGTDYIPDYRESKPQKGEGDEYGSVLLDVL